MNTNPFGFNPTLPPPLPAPQSSEPWILLPCQCSIERSQAPYLFDETTPLAQRICPLPQCLQPVTHKVQNIALMATLAKRNAGGQPIPPPPPANLSQNSTEFYTEDQRRLLHEYQKLDREGEYLSALQILNVLHGQKPHVQWIKNLIDKEVGKIQKSYDLEDVPTQTPAVQRNDLSKRPRLDSSAVTVPAIQPGSVQMNIPRSQSTPASMPESHPSMIVSGKYFSEEDLKQQVALATAQFSEREAANQKLLETANKSLEAVKTVLKAKHEEGKAKDQENAALKRKSEAVEAQLKSVSEESQKEIAVLKLQLEEKEKEKKVLGSVITETNELYEGYKKQIKDLEEILKKKVEEATLLKAQIQTQQKNAEESLQDKSVSTKSSKRQKAADGKSVEDNGGDAIVTDETGEKAGDKTVQPAKKSKAKKSPKKKGPGIPEVRKEDLPTNPGSTDLHVRVLAGLNHKKLQKYITEENINKADDNGDIPIHLALKHKKHRTIIFKLVCNGARFDIPDRDGNTAMHLAAMHGTPGLVDEFLNCGGDPTLTNKDGKMPIEVSKDQKIRSKFENFKRTRPTNPLMSKTPALESPKSDQSEKKSETDSDTEFKNIQDKLSRRPKLRASMQDKLARRTNLRASITSSSEKDLEDKDPSYDASELSADESYDIERSEDESERSEALRSSHSDYIDDDE